MAVDKKRVAACFALATCYFQAGASAIYANASVATSDVNFDIFLPLRNKDQLSKLLEDQQNPTSADYHRWMTPQSFADRFGPTPQDMATATEAIKRAGLTVVSTGARSLHVTGPADAVGALIGSPLRTTTMAGVASRLVANRAPALPKALASVGAYVVAFGNTITHRPLATKSAAVKAIVDNRKSKTGAYWFTDLKQAYDYPAYNDISQGGVRFDGTGATAAVLMSDLPYPGDVQNMFDHEKFTQVSGNKAPYVYTELVNGGGKANAGGSFEASLDIQQITGGAPGAKVTLISIPDLSDDNILTGYNYIVNQNRFDVVNSSFGACELAYTAAYNNGTDYTSILKTYDEIFQQGNAQGITFVAASGDNGALECTDTTYAVDHKNGRFIKGVSHPASSAYVTAVGGTNLVTTKDGTLNSAYVSENGYGDPLVPYDKNGVGATASRGYWGAGGGVSQLTAKPAYQNLVNSGSQSFRTVPDVGMQVGGCPQDIAQQPCGADRSAAVVAFSTFNANDTDYFFAAIGTSAAAPQFVSAVLLYVQKTKGRVGNLNPYLYQMGATQTKAGGLKAPAAQQVYHRDIPGFDGAYSGSYPSNNYNYIVGNGTPDVRKLFGLTQVAPAGIPQTPSNP